MADEGLLQVAPTDATSGGTDSGAPGKLSFLTATWVNKRIENVAARVDAYLARIIDDGLLADGFAPFETPVTDEMLMKMTPEQFRMLFDTEPSLEGKAMLLARMKDLKLPLPIQLPYAPRPYDPPGRLAREPESVIPSSDYPI